MEGPDSLERALEIENPFDLLILDEHTGFQFNNIVTTSKMSVYLIIIQSIRLPVKTYGPQMLAVLEKSQHTSGSDALGYRFNVDFL